MKNKSDDELANIVRLKANTSDGRSAAIEIERRLHQPEKIFGYSVARIALYVSVAALVISVVAIILAR